MNIDVLVGALWGFGMGVLLTIRLLVLKHSPQGDSRGRE